MSDNVFMETNRLRGIGLIQSSNPGLHLQHVGFLAIVEQLEAINTNLAGLREDLKVGGQTLGDTVSSEINVMIPNRQSDLLGALMDPRR